MKFDMHCHTKEGSIDAKVSIEAYINRLVKLGFDGMLISDHNSYKGYDYYKKIEKNLDLPKDFVVLKGIEYDTLDGGHILVILPDDVHSSVLEIRGMRVEGLIRFVHELGGILGPAHPYGNGFFAFMHTFAARRVFGNTELEPFDFIESFNSCMHPIANKKARLLALKYKKPTLAGSDAHRMNIIGTAYTDFLDPITCNNDLIAYIKAGKKTVTPTEKDTPDAFVNQRWPIKHFLIWGYFGYNWLGALFSNRKRKKHPHYIAMNEKK